MTKRLKAPTEVERAEAEVKNAEAVVNRVRNVLADAEAALGRAHEALLAARRDADMRLPKAKMVSTVAGRPSGAPVTVVVLRKTPSGIVKVRHVGTGGEMGFKLDRWGDLTSTPRAAGSIYSTKLIDVPPEFDPRKK